MRERNFDQIGLGFMTKMAVIPIYGKKKKKKKNLLWNQKADDLES